MFNNKFPAKKLILILWVAFSILYVGYNEWVRFRVLVMQNAYNQGVGDAVAKVLDESKNCKGFPVNLGDKNATLVNVECLKQQPQVEPPKPTK